MYLSRKLQQICLSWMDYIIWSWCIIILDTLRLLILIFYKCRSDWENEEQSFCWELWVYTVFTSPHTKVKTIPTERSSYNQSGYASSSKEWSSSTEIMILVRVFWHGHKQNMINEKPVSNCKFKVFEATDSMVCYRKPLGWQRRDITFWFMILG